MRNYRRYPEYKDSGIEWLGKIPSHWEARRLKSITEISLSNVDKKTEEGQEPVLLCNYVDAYKNEYITPDMDFMAATATSEQVRRFALRGGDVLITKDSESWNDIAVPSCVVEDMPDVLCGYHLALIRHSGMESVGRYLARAIAAVGLRDQFWVSANGITRYGLTGDSISTALLPVPPPDEQRAIADFLDRETAKIDTLVEKKERLIQLLKEKRTALITHAVTKGLAPNVPMKDSGIEWLGEIPAHWETTSVRYQFANLDHKRIPIANEDRALLEKIYPYYGASGIIDRVDSYLFDGPLVLVAEDGANLLSRSTPLAFLATGKYWVNNHAHILDPLTGDICYWVGVLQTYDYTPLISGAAQPKLTGDRLGSIRIPLPPDSEQTEIAGFVDRETAELDALIGKIEKAIKLLKEYRTALISAAVTGKIDVRGSAEDLELESE